MKRLKGIAASKGYAIGTVWYLKEKQETVERKGTGDVSEELKILERAFSRAAATLQDLYEKAVERVGENQVEIFQVHKLLLEDEDYTEAIRGRIEEEQADAAYAVWETSVEFEEMFRSMDSEYMQERAADIKDVSGRLVDILLGREEPQDLTGQGILFADDLTPSETIHMDKSKVLAFVTKEGSAISHSAILARTIGIPAVVGVTDLWTEAAKGTVIVDGFKGEVLLQPTEAVIREYCEKKAQYEQKQQQLKALIGKPSITGDGVKIELCCNIGGVDDVEAVIENDGEGIGLFRSEFLYMEGTDFPTEEEQFEAYKAVLAKMSPKRVIVRTLDLGADKHVPYFDLAKEENPAMGYRAIRICLTQEDVFRDQIRALLRASVYGKLAIMFPMIVSVEEVVRVKTFVEKVKEELKAEGRDIADGVELGVMIETPAAAVASDLLAKEVDFFSIGTNDLTQYTLAVDRMNSKVEALYNPRNVSVLRLIKLTADHAHAAGKWVGICGESAADTDLLKFYLAVGLDELSVAPKAVLELRSLLQDIEVEKIRADEIKKWID